MDSGCPPEGLASNPSNCWRAITSRSDGWERTHQTAETLRFPPLSSVRRPRSNRQWKLRELWHVVASSFSNLTTQVATRFLKSRRDATRDFRLNVNTAWSSRPRTAAPSACHRHDPSRAGGRYSAGRCECNRGCATPCPTSGRRELTRIRVARWRARNPK